MPGSGSRLVYLGSGSGSDQCVFTKNHHQKVCKNHEPLGTQPYGYVQVYSITLVFIGSQSKGPEPFHSWQKASSRYASD